MSGVQAAEIRICQEIASAVFARGIARRARRKSGKALGLPLFLCALPGCTSVPDLIYCERKGMRAAGLGRDP